MPYVVVYSRILKNTREFQSPHLKKVIAVAYERGSFVGSSGCSYLTGNILVF